MNPYSPTVSIGAKVRGTIIDNNNHQIVLKSPGIITLYVPMFHVFHSITDLGHFTILDQIRQLEYFIGHSKSLDTGQ